MKFNRGTSAFSEQEFHFLKETVGNMADNFPIVVDEYDENPGNVYDVSYINYQLGNTEDIIITLRGDEPV